MITATQTITYTVNFKADEPEDHGWSKNVTSVAKDILDRELKPYEENTEEFYNHDFHQWFDEQWLGSAMNTAIEGLSRGHEKGLITLYFDDEGHYNTCLVIERDSVLQRGDIVVAWVVYDISEERS